MLREVTKEDLPMLNTFLASKLPDSLSMYLIVRMKEEFGVPINLYVPDCDPTSFVFANNLKTAMHSLCVFWDQARLSLDQIQNYLKQVPNWDWSARFICCALQPDIAKQLDSMLQGGYISSTKLEREFEELCIILELQPENIPTMKLSNDFWIGDLKPNHVPILFASWEYADEESASEYEKFIRDLPTAAVYKVEDKERMNPLSWATLYCYGYIGLAYTLPEFRRLGLASAAMIGLCQKVNKAKLPLVNTVIMSNVASLRFHEKLGYKTIGNVYWNAYRTRT